MDGYFHEWHVEHVPSGFVVVRYEERGALVFRYVFSTDGTMEIMPEAEAEDVARHMRARPKWMVN